MSELSSVHAKNLYQYLPASERDLAWGMTITGAGHQIVDSHSSYPPPHPHLYSFSWEKGRILDEMQLIYIVEGSGELEFEGETAQIVSAGQMILIAPNQWHRYRPSQETGWTEYWMGLQGFHFDQLRQGQQIPSRSELWTIGLHDDLIQWHRLIEHQLQERPTMAQQMASSAGLLFFTKALAQHRSNETRNDDATMKRALMEMVRCADDHLDLHDLAEKLDLNYDIFRHQFREFTGLSPRQYHLQLKLQRAKELLNLSPLSILEISEKLHFESPFYFSRLFKSKMGISPQQWRKRTAVANVKK